MASPKRRNTNAEKTDLRADRIPLACKDKTAKLSHKDRHARCTLKFTKAKSSLDRHGACRSKANEAFMEKQGFVSRVHSKQSHLKPMPCHIQRSNASKSVIRARVEHIFADQKSQGGHLHRNDRH